MYNKITIVGNLGRDPELRYLPNGTAVTSFSVATTHKYTQDGEKKEETTWFRVSVFGNQAEPCNQYLSKGSRALIEGRVRLNEYTTQDGTPRASMDIRSDRVLFLTTKSERPSSTDPGDVPFTDDTDLVF